MNVLKLLLLGVAVAERVRWDGYTAFEVTPNSQEDLDLLNGLEPKDVGIFWWQEPTVVELESEVFVPAQARMSFMDLLERSTMDYKVLAENVQEIFDEQYEKIDAYKQKLSVTKDFSDWDTAYHDYDDHLEWLFEIVSNYSSICRLVEAGRSYQGRIIWAVELYGLGGPDPSKPGIFLNAAIHAREWITPSTVDFMMREMLEGYGVDPEITELVDEIQWTIIPIYNVDGYQYTFDVNPSWRKTRKPNQGSACVGTDPNRNTPMMWGGIGAPNDPCSNTYRGPNTWSEPEVRSVCGFLTSKVNTRAYVDVHAAFHAILESWAFTGTPPPARDRVRAASIAISRAFQDVNGSFFRYGDWYTLMYASSGVMGDYAYEYLGIDYSWTFELRPSFQPPPEFIVDSGAETFAGFKVLGHRIIAEYGNK